MERKVEEKGITMIALVITMIVLLIIAGIAIGTGMRGIKESEEGTKVSELNMVQHAALERYTKASLTKEPFPGTPYPKMEDLEADLSQIMGRITLKDSNAMNYYKLDKTALQELDITNTEDEYIINYKTGEVINRTILITESGKILYLSIK